MSPSAIRFAGYRTSYLLGGMVLSLLTVSPSHATPSCQDERAGVASSSKYQMELDDAFTWQAPGGTIVFAITGPDLDKISVAACLRPLGEQKWAEARPLEPVPLAPSDGKTRARFAVSLPAKEAKGFSNYGVRFYPPAELRVTVADASSARALDVVRGIRISPVWFAALSAVLFVAFAAWALYSFAVFLRVPGTGVILRIISTASGWASLAQFQIILWTLVIGAGAVYVMTLRGTLIDISAGTLGLLGIAGAAAVGSQLKSSQQAQAGSALVLPGPVALASGAPTASEVLLSWSAPSSGGTPTAYTVQFQPAGAAGWFTASTAVTRPRFLLIGLTPGTNYTVQVFATNAAGSGPATPLAIATPAAPAAPGGVPPAVTGLARQGNVTSSSIPLAWTAQAGVTYTVEFRAHNSDEPWRIFGAGLNMPTVTVTGLRPDTPYDFRVFAVSAAGNGAPSQIVTETSGTRTPKWSDIVTDTDRPAEIDVTRVQMLFFTVISACFVALRIVSSGAIPEIPASYVGLMGISNGVYLTAKFTSR